MDEPRLNQDFTPLEFLSSNEWIKLFKKSKEVRIKILKIKILHFASTIDAMCESSRISLSNSAIRTFITLRQFFYDRF